MILLACPQISMYNRAVHVLVATPMTKTSCIFSAVYFEVFRVATEEIMETITARSHCPLPLE